MRANWSKLVSRPIISHQALMRAIGANPESQRAQREHNRHATRRTPSAARALSARQPLELPHGVQERLGAVLVVFAVLHQQHVQVELELVRHAAVQVRVRVLAVRALWHPPAAADIIHPIFVREQGGNLQIVSLVNYSEHYLRLV
eukprot:349079-Prorocentrum_minimum.AAC.1